MMRDAHVDDEIAGYLLDMVDARQRGRIAAHLAGCPQCARVRRDQALVLTPLAADVDDVVPPPMLKRRLLAEARASLEPASAPEPTLARPHSLLPFKLDPASSNRFLRWASLWMAAAFIIGLVGGVTGWALVLGDRLDRKSNELDASRDTLETLIHSDAIATMDGTSVARRCAARSASNRPARGCSWSTTSRQHRRGRGTSCGCSRTARRSRRHGIAGQPRRHRRAGRAGDAAYQRMQLDLEPLGAGAPGGQVVLAGALP